GARRHGPGDHRRAAPLLQRGEDDHLGRAAGGRAVGAAVGAALVDVGEEGGEAVEVLLGERVVLVVVALGTAQGGAEPGPAEVADAVGGVLGPVLAVLGAALVGGLEDAVVAGGDALLLGGAWEQVAGQLLHRELVEGLVVVERQDHPVAVGG